MKTQIITGLLVAALALIPINGSPQEAPPPKDNATIAWACVTLIVGSIMVYALIKLCRNIPTIEPPAPPPPPPKPPIVITNTNQFRTNFAMLQMPQRSLAQTLDWQMVTLTMETSPDLKVWIPVFFVTNWVNITSHVYVIADAAGSPFRTNWNSITGTEPFSFVDASELMPPADKPTQFFRMVAQ